MLWAGVRPITYVLVFWFAIEFGIRGGRSVDAEVPFLFWLVPGMFAWQYISGVMGEGTNSIRRNASLVTKGMFPSITIPQFSVLSLFIVHIILMIGVVIAFPLFGFMPTIYWLQLPYFFLANFALTLLISTFFSVLTVYSRDISQLLRSFTQMLFWFSAIIWPLSNLSGTLRHIVMLNPIVYVIEGYRRAMIYGIWFWETSTWALYFWAFIIVFSIITLFVWSRMAKNFADVL